jgi:hypothetical protein
MGNPWFVRDGKAILKVTDLKHTKRLKVKKVWPCELCDKNINIGEYAIKQGISNVQLCNGYEVYFHEKCCEVKLFQWVNGELMWEEVDWQQQE